MLGSALTIANMDGTARALLYKALDPEINGKGMLASFDLTVSLLSLIMLLSRKPQLTVPPTERSSRVSATGSRDIPFWKTSQSFEAAAPFILTLGCSGAGGGKDPPLSPSVRLLAQHSLCPGGYRAWIIGAG